MQNDDKSVINKKLVINFLYTFVLFFSFLGIISILLYLLQQAAIESEYRDSAMSLAICAVYFLASLAGLGLFVTTLFTGKLPFRILLVSEIIIIAVFLILFTITILDLTVNLPQLTFLQQALYFSALLSLHIHQEYLKNKKADTENIDVDDTKEEDKNIDENINKDTNEE